MRTKHLWRLQIGTLISAGVWAIADPLFVPTVSSLRSLLAALASGAELNQTVWAVGWTRAGGMAALFAAGAGSLLAIFYCTLVRTRKRVGDETSVDSRSLRSLFGLTTVVAIWCALAISHDSIAWQGKCLRFAMRIDQLEDIVDPLRSDWPHQDGELQEIGPFMAYPFGRPTTLILLQAPSVSNDSVYVSAVERSSNGAIKLQLTGADGGDWVEWHPHDSRPDSFVGGLADRHELRDAVEIGRGWYLVRYGAPPEIQPTDYLSRL